MMQLLGNVWQFLKKLAVKLQYDPEISPLGTHPRELKKKMYVYRKSCIETFIAVPLIVAEKCRPLKRPSTDK